MMSETTQKTSMGSKVGRGCLIILAGLVGLGILGAIIGDEQATDNADIPTTTTANLTEPQAVELQEEPANSLTGPQNNAVRSATQYLAISGFSRQGLIEQLSSDAGEGYELADATAAVDSLTVDWNEQAARSAKQYLNMSGFSCKGLIEQLSSSAGDGYTTSEATYGATQAGAC